MKNIRILAVAASAAVVGLSACGTSTPTASPVPADKDCTEVARPSDPNGLIGTQWPWMSACSALDDVTPGVDQARAEEIVFDARERVSAAKRSISLWATLGNKADPQALAEYRSYIENVRGRLASELVDSHLALAGHAPEGFSLDFTRSADPSKTCAESWDVQACLAAATAERTPSASPGLPPGK